MSEIACPACGAANPDLNPRCAKCGAALPEDSRGVDPALAETLPLTSGPVPKATPAAGIEVPPGARLGRFVVHEELGRGGMGVVVKAQDPALDRTVAIKVLRQEVLGLMGAAEARERLLREAKAMAKVSHRNVVNVHEVDVAGEQVLVVMEHIQGRSLRAWLREQPRSLEEVLDVFLQAGRGLAEVHRTGLIHRDFKPDNVLVGADGRVCVTDFGLVGLVREPGAAGDPAHAGRAPEQPEPVVTSTGVLMGTPAYMAPEQHELKRIDARADQFAFCVSLYEALYGQRPFAGATYNVILASVTAGLLQPAPEGATVPAWLRRVVLRGLALRPEDRYPSMELLLADLEKDPRAARRRVLLGAVAAGLVATAVFGAVRVARSGADLCKGGADRLAGVWDAPARAAVEKAFLATGKSYAGDTYRRVAKVLDGRAASWIDMYTDSCEATHVRGEQSAQLLDARTGCLERRRTELSALAALLASGPSVDVLNRAVEAAYSLPGIDACANRDALLAAVPLPADPAAVSRIAAARAVLAKVSVQLQTKVPKGGMEAVRSMESEVRALEYAPLLAEWLVVRGLLERTIGDYQAAEETFRSAAVEAARAKNDALLADIWTAQIDVIGLRRARYAEALALEAAALGAVERAGGTPVLRGKLLAGVTLVLTRKGEHERALATARSAVEVLEKAPGGESLDLARVVDAEGAALFALHRLDEARASYERAFRIRERLLGENHGTVATSLAHLAMVYAQKGEPEQALPLMQRVASIFERLFGPDHHNVGMAVGNVAFVLADLGRYEEALQDDRRSVAILEKVVGPDHPSVADGLVNRAYILRAQGKPAEARPHLERALAIREKAHGPKHRYVGSIHADLGRTLCAQGQMEAGRAHLQTALTTYEEVGQKEDPDVAMALQALGECLLRAGSPARARPSLERSLAIAVARAGDMKESQLAEVEFSLAQALWPVLADRKRALELAASARDRYAKAGGRHVKEAARVEAWMKAHPAPGGP